MTDDVDLLVVGAGLCGLSHAWRETLRGRDVLLVEATDRVGGVIRTDQIGPYRVERAAAAFPSSAEHLLALHASLPNPPAIVDPPPEANRQLLWTRRGLVPAPRTPPALLRSPLLGFGSKLRLLSEALRGPRRSTRPESAHAFVRRRFGSAVADRLLRPMTLGIYGAAPHDLGAADAFPSVVALERRHGSVLRALRANRPAPRTLRTFADGMETFPRAIASALGSRVRPSTRVDSITVEDGRPAARLADGSIVRAREVVLATTAPDQARLVQPLSPAAAEILASVRYAPMVVAAVGLRPENASHVPPAFGFLRSPEVRARILGATFASSLSSSVAPPCHALLNVFLGGTRDPDALDLDDDAIRAIVGVELSRALGHRIDADLFDLARYARAVPTSGVGHRSRMAAASRLLATSGIRLWGSHVSGVGVHSCTEPMPLFES